MKSLRSSFYGDVEVWPISWWENKGRVSPGSTQVLRGCTPLCGAWVSSSSSTVGALCLHRREAQKNSLKLLAFTADSPLQFRI